MTSRLSSPLLRNVFAVASGTAMAQVIIFAFSPLITRIYSPEVFGLQGVFMSLVSILSPVIALRYPMAIITADTDTEMLQLARLSLLVAAGMACALWLLLVFGGAPLFALVGAEGLGHLIYLLPVALFCVTFQDVADFRAARLGAFRLVGIVAVIVAFVTSGAKVLGGLIAPVAGTLIVFNGLAPALKATLLRQGARDLRVQSPRLNRTDMLRLLRKYRDFPIYRVPTDVLNAGSQAIPVIMLAALFSPAAAGFYALTRTVLNLPINIVGTAIGNVLYARFAELNREGEPLLPLLLRFTAALLILSPIIIVLAWFAPIVFAFVFGEEWREAGRYAQWMALWLGVSLANIPAVRLAPVINAQNILLFANVLILILRTVSILGVAWIGGGAGLAVAAFSVVGLAANVSLIIALTLSCAKYDQERG